MLENNFTEGRRLSNKCLAMITYLSSKSISHQDQFYRTVPVTYKLYHNVVSSTPRHEPGSTSVIGTDCTGSCKSYHTITVTTSPPPPIVIDVSSKTSKGNSAVSTITYPG